MADNRLRVKGLYLCKNHRQRRGGCEGGKDSAAIEKIGYPCSVWALVGGLPALGTEVDKDFIEHFVLSKRPGIGLPILCSLLPSHCQGSNVYNSHNLQRIIA